jgi:hypothetical protein
MNGHVNFGQNCYFYASMLPLEHCRHIEIVEKKLLLRHGIVAGDMCSINVFLMVAVCVYVCVCVRARACVCVLLRVYDPQSGRRMEVYTDQPGLQLYTGNFLDGLIGKNRHAYSIHSGFCMETQNYPNAINVRKLIVMFVELKSTNVCRRLRSIIMTERQ